MRQSQQLLGAYKQNAFNNTRIMRRHDTFYGLGNREGKETYRPFELHQHFQNKTPQSGQRM